MSKNLGFSLPFSKELLCGGHNVGEIGRVPGLAGFLLRRDHAAEQDLQGTQIWVFIKLCETTEVDTLKKIIQYRDQTNKNCGAWALFLAPFGKLG